VENVRDLVGKCFIFEDPLIELLSLDKMRRRRRGKVSLGERDFE
jgi:hypothetical protein